MDDLRSFAASFRAVAAALTVAPPFITGAVLVALPSTYPTPLPGSLFFGVAAILLHQVLKRLYGVQLPDPELGRTVTSTFQSEAILRFSIAEALVLFGVAFVFVAGSGPVPLVVAALGSSTLIYLHVYPSRAHTRRYDEAMIAKNSSARISEAFGHPAV